MVEPSAQFGVVAILEQIHQPAEQVGRELNVEVDGLIVQQRHSLTQTRDEVLARQRKRGCLRWPCRFQCGADQQPLNRLRVLLVGSRFAQRGKAALENRE